MGDDSYREGGSQACAINLAQLLNVGGNETGDHRIPQPKEVWTVEEPDGFITSIEIVRDDATREIVKVNRR